METTTEDSVFIAGGGTHYSMKNGTAKLFAFSFDENMDIISTLNLPSKSEKTMGVTVLKRMRKTDVVFAGVHRSVFVVEWTGSHFEILNEIIGIHSCKFFLLL